VNRCFEGKSHLYSQGKKNSRTRKQCAASLLDVFCLAKFRRWEWRRCNIYNYRCENLKSYKKKFPFPAIITQGIGLSALFKLNVLTFKYARRTDNQSTEHSLILKSIVASFMWLVAGLPPRRSGFNPRSVHVEFMVDKLALG
jgi:hypothetical protein